MQKIQLSFLTPKYFDGCHRSGLSNYLPNPSFFQNVDVTSPFAFPQSEKSFPPISTGRLVLNVFWIESLEPICPEESILFNIYMKSTVATVGRIRSG